MSLRVIDISSWQEGIDISAIDCDAVIIKATGGTSYVNPLFKQWADEVLACGKCLGCYHYACEYDSEPGGRAEAEYFWDHVKDYKGKFIPVLDWENHAVDMPVSYAKEFLDRIAELSGATPWFYGYAGNVNSTDYSSIAKYPLWMASYLYRYFGAGFVDDPDNIWGTGAWDHMVAYQYTSTGDIADYDGNIDLSVFYGDEAYWKRFCGEPTGQVPGEPKNDAGVSYHVHCQNYGDFPTVRDGQTAGTTGQSLRLEAITFDSLPEGWVIEEAKVHIQNEGWRSFKNITAGSKVVIGTTGQAKRLEMVEFTVKKPEGDKRKLKYQVHVQNYGWLGVTDEGYATGCDGQARRIEAIRIWVE